MSEPPELRNRSALVESTLKLGPFLIRQLFHISHYTSVNLFKEPGQTGKYCRFDLEHVLPEFRNVVDEVRGCASVQPVIEPGYPLGDVTEWKIRECCILSVNRHGTAQRFGAVNDVAVA